MPIIKIKSDYMTVKQRAALVIVAFLSFEGCGSISYKAEVVHTKPKAVQLMLRNDCFACHSVVDRVAGPPYLDVSRRYLSPDAALKKRLANKIAEGGGGLWYGGYMSPHPLLKLEQIDAMVDWVLAIHSMEQTWFQQCTPQQVSDWDLMESGRFRMEVSTNGNSEVLRSGHGDQVCFWGARAFASLEGKMVQVSGQVEIKVPGKYLFRLHKTGVGSLKINDQVVIREDVTDHEYIKELSEGSYSLVLNYQPVSASDTLILSWMTPSAEYFTVIGQ
ncbi:hypothetical protein BGP76_00420 [Reichenbachiella sp. MSK19-1]|nr:hypothetical protein BGP76_00420 [Reichenbachiella sp. MSK19-1]